MSSTTVMVLCIALLPFVPETTAYGRCNTPSRRGEHRPCTEMEPKPSVLEEMQLSSSASCTNLCPLASAHSKAAYCIKDVSQTCSVGINQNCPPCGIYKKVAGQQCKFYYPSVEGNATYPHWIIMPCAPVSGIESILDGSKASATNFLWSQAWTDATQGQNGRPRITKGQLGLVMNSFYYRSQHQMHIHAARLQADFIKDCLNTLPAKFQTQWSYPTGTQCKFDMLSIYTGSLSNVNKLVRQGAKDLENKYGSPSTQVGALVTGNLSKSYNPHQGYIVTVFVGNDFHGDHDILEYSTK